MSDSCDWVGQFYYYFDCLRSSSPGDEASDLDISDLGSVTSDTESESDDAESDVRIYHTGPSDGPLSVDVAVASLPGMAETEFSTEVKQSLERAFTEGHSVDNAAVELKTLRMASNVPLTRVREAVVAAIVEHIPLVEGGGAAQRKEISSVIGRWGPLIDRIGGMDAVETVCILQVRMYTVQCSRKLIGDDSAVPLCVIKTNATIWANIGSTVSRGHCRRR